ncbi:MAG: taurine dioxygenase [Rhodospirillaceae bacterium]|jgi:taurine dioxygenase|nr:taurine dioxygenase [Rhodospirillaceae bacterium]
MANIDNVDSIEIRPLAGVIGAEIFGVDVASGLSNLAREQIHQAFLDHKAIFFRDQNLSPRQLVDFAGLFGKPGIYPFVKHVDDYPEIIELLTTETDTVNFGRNWHSDTTYMPKPFLGTVLYALETPSFGGDTQFANMTAAYEALSDGMKAMLDGLHAVNSSAQKRLGGRANKMKALSAMKDTYVKESEPIEAVHPVVRTHPETGEKALYVNRSHSVHFDGMTEEESEPVLKYLFDHCTRPEFLCRFRWEPGSIAVWDNRCTLHQAIGDYFGSRRRMHRVTLEGDAPA